MADFVLVCNLCKQIVSGDPLKHIVEQHDPQQFFTLVPRVTWDKLGVRVPPEKV